MIQVGIDTLNVSLAYSSLSDVQIVICIGQSEDNVQLNCVTRLFCTRKSYKTAACIPLIALSIGSSSPIEKLSLEVAD